MENDFSLRKTKFAAGTASAPGLHFGDATTGLYRSAANEVAITAGGTQVFKAGAGAISITGTLTVSSNITLSGNLYGTGTGRLIRSTVANYPGLFTLGLQRSSTLTTQDNDYLGQFEFTGYNAAGTPGVAAGADILTRQVGAAGALYLGARLIFRTGTNAAALAERMVIKSTGEVECTGAFAINGATAPAKATISGVLTSAATLADVRGVVIQVVDMLESMGFNADTTTR